MPETERWVVLGLGNVLYRDEGLGVHALNAMRSDFYVKPESSLIVIEMLDGGTLGLDLLPIVESATHLLVLDAVDAGALPGTLIELEKSSILQFGGIRLSQHQLSFQQVLGLAHIRDCLPTNLHLIGVQPADLSVGLELSPQVSAVMPKLVERAWLVLFRWCENPDDANLPC